MNDDNADDEAKPFLGDDRDIAGLIETAAQQLLLHGDAIMA